MIKSNCIIVDGKALISFNHSNNNYYEIGQFIKNNNNFNFVVEYLIKENKNSQANIYNIFFYLYEINKMIEKHFPHNTNEIKIQTKFTIGCYYRIEENNSINKESTINNYNYDYKFILIVISFLTSIYFFEKDIKDILNKKNGSNKQNNNVDKNNKNKFFYQQQCYLINKNFYIDMKKVFSEDELINFVNEYKIESDIDENLINNSVFYYLI